MNNLQMNFRYLCEFTLIIVMFGVVIFVATWFACGRQISQIMSNYEKTAELYCSPGFVISIEPLQHFIKVDCIDENGIKFERYFKK